MAITIHQKPNDIHPMNGRAMVVIKSTNVAQLKFRYRVTIFLDGQEMETTLVTPDPSGVGLFDIGPRIRKFIYSSVSSGLPFESEKTIFDHTAGEIFARGFNALRSIEVKVREFYSQGEDLPAIERGTEVSFIVKGYPGATKLSEGHNYLPEEGFLTDDLSMPLVTNTNKSASGRVVRVLDTDRYVMPFFNVTGSLVSYFEYRSATSDTLSPEIQIDLTNRLFGGGSDELLQFMCGPKDLSDFSGIPSQYKPSATSDWKFYTLQAFNANDEPVSQKFTFNRKSCSDKYTRYQLMFVNRFGFWNLQSFYMKSERTLRVRSGKEYDVQVGDTSRAADSSFGHQSWERQTGVYGKKISEELRLNSDFLDEAEANDLSMYIGTRDAWILEEGSKIPVPVIISNRSYRENRPKRLKQYEITVRIAQNHYST